MTTIFDVYKQLTQLEVFKDWIIVEDLLAKSEGPNTFWAKTNHQNVESAKKRFPHINFRNNNGVVEMLAGSKEGPNTFWSGFDLAPDKDWVYKNNPPVDPRLVLRNKPISSYMD